MNRFGLFPLLLLMLTGCTTVTKYESKTDASPPKPEGYPIYIYAQKVKVPRAFEIIGTTHVGDTPFTVFGGSLESELKELRQKARRKGADALQIISVESPGFFHASYRVDANFIRFTDVWESVSSSEDDLQAYVRTNAQMLDPVEGIWAASDLMQSRIGIVKDVSKPGRFVAFILDTSNPTWRKGDKKMDIVSGEHPGIYRGSYYLADYRRESVVFALRGPRANTFVIGKDEGGMPIVFSRQTIAGPD
jgi:hypothetical protein